MIDASPLAGQHVLVTRPVGQADGLIAALESVGAAVTAVPTIRLAPPADTHALSAAVLSLDAYDWVVVTSVNAVERLASEIDPLDTRACRWAAVGPTTAKAAAGRWPVECLVPSIYRSESLAERLIASIPTDDMPSTRILLVQAESARPILRDRLVAAGARVDVAPAYSVEVNWSAREALLEFVELGTGDWLTFTASSSARAFVDLVGPQTGGASIAAISPITAGAISELGLPVHAVASDHSMTGLVAGLVDAVRHEREVSRSGSGR